LLDDPFPFLAASITTLAACTTGLVASLASRRRVKSEVESVEAEFTRVIRSNVGNIYVASSNSEESTASRDASEDPRLSAIEENLEKISKQIAKNEVTEGVLTIRTTALIDVYHRQGLVQYRVSFWFSIILATLGFAAIAYAIVAEGGNSAVVVSGVITEAVAALFFTQSNQSRNVITSYMDKAREDRRFQTALQLAENIPDQKLRSALQAVLALEILEAKTLPGILPGFSTKDGAAGVGEE